MPDDRHSIDYDRVPNEHHHYRANKRVNDDTAALTNTDLDSLGTEYNELRPYLKDYEKFMHLESWMQRGGADISKIKVEFYDENFRGVHAKQDIGKNETIMFVPLGQILPYEFIQS